MIMVYNKNTLPRLKCRFTIHIELKKEHLLSVASVIYVIVVFI